MRILLTGNIFHDYESDLKDGLISCGHQVDMLFSNIHGPFHPSQVSTVVSWVKYGLLPYKLKINYFRDKAHEIYNCKVAKLLKCNKYDLLLVVNAKTLQPEAIMNYRGPKVLWFFDSLTRYQEVLNKVNIFDYVFVFEPTDVPFVKQLGQNNVKYLATGFNPRIFYNTNSKKLVDFSFVGSYYPKRDEYLRELVSVSDKMDLYGDFYRSNSSYLKAHVRKMLIPRSKTNDIYNRTKINLNIHHFQSREGLSPRTFEILGAGGFQMVERQNIALEFFKEDFDICLYESKDEFLDKAQFYLSHDSKRAIIASNGHKKAMQMHTWKHRFEELFKTVSI